MVSARCLRLHSFTDCVIGSHQYSCNYSGQLWSDLGSFGRFAASKMSTLGHGRPGLPLSQGMSNVELVGVAH
jgi:hypothetical protein